MRLLPLSSASHRLASLSLSFALHVSHYPLSPKHYSTIGRAFSAFGSVGKLDFGSGTSLRGFQTTSFDSQAAGDVYALPSTPHGAGLNPIPLTAGQRYVTLGDIHGDLGALGRMLKLAGVISKSVPVTAENVQEIEWTGGGTIIVQLGDILDRGITELSCWKLLTSLGRQAGGLGEGGGVNLLFGNHEILNMLEVWNYVAPGGDNEFDAEFGGGVLQRQADGTSGTRSLAMKPGTGLLVSPMLSSFNLALHVGSTIFVHGGLTSKHLKSGGGTIGAMNKGVREWVERDFKGDGRVMRRTLPGALGGGVASQVSPIWMRDYSKPSGGSVGGAVSFMIEVSE